MNDQLQMKHIDFSKKFWRDKHVVIDSRNVMNYESSIFFALPGNKTDGHQFIETLFKKGVRHFVVLNETQTTIPEVCLYRTNNVVTVLQELAQFHRSQFDYPVVGITGSNGKTSLKEWLFELLHADYSIIKSPKSYNSQIGVPLSILGMRSEHNLAIFEAGISKQDEMKNLQTIIQPTIGIFTNIGDAHSSGFTNQYQKLIEKLQLFKNSDLLIYNADIGGINEYLKQTNVTCKKLTWSIDTSVPADFHLINKGQIVQLVGQYQQTKWLITIPFQNAAWIENAIHAILYMIYLGFHAEIIQKRLDSLSSVSSRLSIIEGTNRCILIDDTYNNDLEGLKIALEVLHQQFKDQVHQRKTMILSDFKDTSTGTIYDRMLHLLKVAHLDRLILVGPQFTPYLDQCKTICDTLHFTNTKVLLDEIDTISFQDEVVLVKGARSYHFENVIDRLKRQIHATQLEINIAHMVHNVEIFKKQLSPNTKIMAMVKASAYGSGSIQVAKALSHHQIDYLGVAYTDEGIALRKNGITLPIMVMNAQPRDLAMLLSNNLSPTIHSTEHLKQFIDQFHRQELNRPLSVHLEINSGMNRLGFNPEDIIELTRIIKGHKTIVVEAIFSHLSAADNRDYDSFTKEQIRVFKQVSEQIENELDIQPIRHLLNSAGISHFNDAEFDMVRLGIGLYGIDPNDHLNQLLPVLSLKSRIAQIRLVKAGQSIGYDRADFSNKDRKIAIVSIGYADGLFRQLSKGCGELYIKGEPVKIVGNICMDMCFVDISALKDVHVGDEVIVFKSIDHNVNQWL